MACMQGNPAAALIDLLSLAARRMQARHIDLQVVTDEVDAPPRQNML